MITDLAHTRAQAVQTDVCYCFTDCQLNTSNCELHRGGEYVHLEPLAFNLLVYLIENRQRCVSRDELFCRLWPGKVVTDAALSNEIKYLRHQLGDNGAEQSIINTHHRRGYQFVAPLQATAERKASQPTTVHHQRYHSSFIGRDQQIEVIRAWLQLPGNGLLTISGPGGIGKTRLANEVIDRVHTAVEYEVCYLTLADIHDSQSFARRLAQEIGHGSQHSFSADEVGESLLLIGRHIGQTPTLLVLDNMDHLLVGADVLLELFKQATALKILSTCRSALGIPGERVLVLQGLPTDENGGAMQLLSDRAAAHNEMLSNDFTELDAHCAQRICQRLDGSPLGIELAAPWLSLMSLPELEQHLSTSLMWLESHNAEHSPRHRNIHRLFEHSWQHLTAEDQRAFAGLCLFPGGFTVESAMAVCHLNPPKLAALQGQGLIQRTNGARLHIHELLRQFGQQKLRELDPTHSFLQRMAQYYSDFCKHYAHQVETDYNRLLIQRVRDEWTNMLNIIDRIIAQQNWPALYQITLVLTKLPTNVLEITDLYEKVYQALKEESIFEATDILYRLLCCYNISGHYTDDFPERCSELANISERSQREFYRSAADALMASYFRFHIVNELQADQFEQAHYERAIRCALNSDTDAQSDPLTGYACLACSALKFRRHHFGLALHFANLALQIGSRLKDQYLLFSCHHSMGRSLSALLLTALAQRHLNYCYQHCAAYNTPAEKIHLIASFALQAYAVDDCALAVQLLAKAHQMLNQHYQRTLSIDRLILPTHRLMLLNRVGSSDYEKLWQAGEQMPIADVDRQLQRLLSCAC